MVEIKQYQEDPDEEDMDVEAIVDQLFEMNGTEYNLHKAAEECMELALVLTQRLTKPTKVSDQAIIDEMGDVIIRLMVLSRIFPPEEIDKRIDKKLSKFRDWQDHKLYSKI